MQQLIEADPETFGIASAQFLLFAVVAVFLIIAVREKRLMAPVLCVLNLCFLSFFAMSVDSLLVLLSLLAMTFALGEVKARFPDRLPDLAWALVVVGLWALLFLVKDPDLFAPLNPFFHFPVSIIGISYLIFRSINYILDVEILEKRSPLTFLNFMIFWPTLIAGPIERFDNFTHDYHGRSAYSGADVLPLLHRIANGFIKKFVVADNLAPWGIFQVGSDPGYGSAILAAAILIQLFVIYMDFSGYCDIMIGLAGLMGFKLIENFDRPFSANNLQAFWSRWHISLTSFIRDYVFTPLSRFVLPRLHRNMHFGFHLANYFLTMMLIALWHDTTWGFLVFGLMHGAVMVLIQVRKRYLPNLWNQDSLISINTGRVLTYCFVSCSATLWFFGVTGSLAIFARVLELN